MIGTKIFPLSRSSKMLLLAYKIKWCNTAMAIDGQKPVGADFLICLPKSEILLSGEKFLKLGVGLNNMWNYIKIHISTTWPKGWTTLILQY